MQPASTRHQANPEGNGIGFMGHPNASAHARDFRLPGSSRACCKTNGMANKITTGKQCQRCALSCRSSATERCCSSASLSCFPCFSGSLNRLCSVPSADRCSASTDAGWQSAPVECTTDDAISAAGKLLLRPRKARGPGSGSRSRKLLTQGCAGKARQERRAGGGGRTLGVPSLPSSRRVPSVGHVNQLLPSSRLVLSGC